MEKSGEARKYVKEFDIHGYPCKIAKSDFGFLCGYIGVPKNHRFYGVHYMDMDTNVHGGWTFSDFIDDDDWWYFGFDCAHVGDYIPAIEFHNSGDVYRDEAFVESELQEAYTELHGRTV